MEKDSGMEVGSDSKSPMKLRKVVNNNVEGGASTSEQHPVVAEWMDLFAKEMANASDLDDARNHADRALASLEETIRTAISVVSQNLQQENARLKEQIKKPATTYSFPIEFTEYDKQLFDAIRNKKVIPYQEPTYARDPNFDGPHFVDSEGLIHRLGGLIDSSDDECY